MILCETRRRQRRNGVHAETEEEYLQKLAKQDECQQILLEHQQPSPQLEGFIINHDFSFDPFSSEPIFLLEKATIYKSHFLLLICEDFSMNLKRLQSILDSSETSDNLTDSTTEEQTQSSYIIFKQDCYVHTITFGNVIHKFHIWILNHLNPLQIFQELYYPLFNAFVVVVNKGNNSKQNLFQAEFTKMLQFNQSVQYHTISDSDDLISEKQNSLLNILKSLVE
ncbi:unnamed protein product [Paramecium pentaurelia]|uniref:Uncharacterized protein n=1 Tax=Paramecium pentaurelia TaxID=43138 RepID=A0A8S1TCM3_9CILI|nr:unnamed protein product [Paramecium pentaurelia]